MRVLVTGFGAFPNAPTNPTAGLVADLARERGRLARCGVHLRTLVLPVLFGASDDLAAAIAADCPRIMLHFGLAGRRTSLTIEMRAANRAGILHPDAGGRPAHSLLIVAGEPSHRSVRFPVRETVAAIRRAGVACRASIDAGDYICNETLFRSLRSPVPIVGFVHVPPLRRRGTRRGGGLTRGMLTRSAVLAILAAARRARRQERAISSTASP